MKFKVAFTFVREVVCLGVPCRSPSHGSLGILHCSRIFGGLWPPFMTWRVTIWRRGWSQIATVDFDFLCEGSTNYHISWWERSSAQAITQCELSIRLLLSSDKVRYSILSASGQYAPPISQQGYTISDTRTWQRRQTNSNVDNVNVFFKWYRNEKKTTLPSS